MPAISKILIIQFSLFIVLSVGLLFSCKNDKRNDKHKNISSASIENGRVLAIKYCQSCHLLPDPSLLDSKSWEKGVLPDMGPRLGIFFYGSSAYPSFRNDRNINPGFYPSKPLLGFTEWQNIIDYYVATSPDSLPGQQRQYPVQMNLPFFTVQVPAYSYKNATSTYVKINSTDTSHPLIVSDASRKKIYFLDKQLVVKDSVRCSSPVVNMDLLPGSMLECNIGILNPNNGKFGKAKFIKNVNGRMREDSIALFDSLRRPVQITAADLNNDGKPDYLVCEFGNLVGQLSWMENLGGNKFLKHVLRATPGAIRAYVNDYNHDGLPDIWVLFAQGEEGIFLFTNKGGGNFKTEEVLRFPPVYGSSYFELADFNNDGYPDIVYTCGDNADFSPVLKPYHGVYLFLNDKTNHFKQQFFFPINGCYKAIARDFDGDGDLDLATISFFADYKHQPEEGFIYLENKGNFDFHPYSFPQAKSGRWLNMDAGDIDGDGKIDIILANFCIGSSKNPNINWTEAPPFIVLKNKGD